MLNAILKAIVIGCSDWASFLLFIVVLQFVFYCGAEEFCICMSSSLYKNTMRSVWLLGVYAVLSTLHILAFICLNWDSEKIQRNPY